MDVKVEGFLSCICVAQTPNDLQSISEFSNFLEAVHRNFEIIICIVPNSIESILIQEYCTKSTSLAIYEISASGSDALFTAGLELALGDWILELPDVNALTVDTRLLFSMLNSDLERNADSYQLIPKKWNFFDRILSTMSSVVLEVPVHTMIYMPRLTKRTALQTWNSRKLRSKVLRVAPQLSRGVVLAKKEVKSASSDRSRLVRIGARTLAHSSAKPLRWVSFFSLFSASISVLISFVILIVGINRKVVPGWTTTNLQISGLSFLILSVLGVLTEYIYQIAAASIDQPSFRVIREYMSPHYIFSVDPNIVQSDSE